MNDATEKLRLDKWLWAARFFKTRVLAVEAVETGKVQVNGARAKPSKTLAVADRLVIRLGPYHHEVEVLGLSGKRGPAAEAHKLYSETEASRLKREALALELKAQFGGEAQKGRPTKKDRREIARFKNGAW